jgi:HEPN domain-containing protein
MPPDDFPGAASKHVLDGEALLAANRFDGAGYLAGYAVECTIKTLVQVEGAASRRVHNLEDLSREALRLAVLPSQRTARYLTNPDLTTLTYGDPPGWNEKLRYQPDGYVGEASAKAWVAEARRLYDEVIVQMKLNGDL